MTPTSDGRPEDATPPRRIRAHEVEYGKHAVSYDEAFDLAIAGVVSSEKNADCPRSIIKADAELAGHPLSKDELDQVMAQLVAAGIFELLGVGESSEQEDDPKENWVFGVDVETQSDHGFWAAVHRDTGKVIVSGFN